MIEGEREAAEGGCKRRGATWIVTFGAILQQLDRTLGPEHIQAQLGRPSSPNRPIEFVISNRAPAEGTRPRKTSGVSTLS